jgi:hypothetical protein
MKAMDTKHSGYKADPRHPAIVLKTKVLKTKILRNADVSPFRWQTDIA